MTLVGLAALISHWRRNPVQLFALVFGLALATALWAGVQAINAEARASYDTAASVLGEGQYDQILPRNGDVIAQSTYIKLRRAGWQVSPVLEGRFGTGPNQIRVLGLDLLTAPVGLVPIGQDIGRDIGTLLGEPFVFAHPDTAQDLPYHWNVQVIEDATIATGLALIDIGVAQQVLGRSGELSRLIVGPAQPRTQADLAQLAPELLTQKASEGQNVERLTDSFHLNLTAFGLLSFAVGIFIVNGVIGLAFEQRRSLVRTLRALGLPLRQLVWLLIGELVLIAVVSGSLGVVLGYFIAAFLLPDVAATLRGLYGADVAGTLQLRPSWWVSGFAITFLGTALAAVSALWKTAQMPILASAKPRAWAVQTGIGSARLAGVALILLLIASALVFLGSGLIAGFVLLGCLLTGAALLLPYCLLRSVTFAEQMAKGPVTSWFWADTRQQVPGLSLALMALLLATATNVGVSTMVSSFRDTFVGFLDQRLAPELYVAAESDAQSRTLDAYLTRNTREVLPVTSVDISVDGIEAALFGVRVGTTYETNWRFLTQSRDDVWAMIKAGKAAIINEQLARRAGLWPGDVVQISTDLTLPIAAVVADYGNPVGQVVIGEGLYLTHYPDRVAQRFGIRTDAPETLKKKLIKDLSIAPNNIINQAQIKAFSLRVFEQTFKVTGALNVLTLVVAAFAILMSLLTLSTMRVPQLAPAWALGMTRRQLGNIELVRAVVLAALTTILAVPLGLALAWVLLSVVNVEAFGWKLPMFLFPWQYGQLAVFTMSAAILAALIPARKLSHTPPSVMLKVFANDR